MHVNKIVRVGLLAVAPALTALAAAVPAVAAPAPHSGAAAHMPGHALGAPAVQASTAVKPNSAAGYFWSAGDTYYAYNTAGKAVTVTPDDPVAGEYAVFFNGLQSIGFNGDVQVSSYDTADTCTVVGWGAVAATEEVDVACYTPSGTLDTTANDFDVTITDPLTAPSGVFDYAWISPDNKSMKLSGFGQYNSSHKANQVKHLAAGSYVVTFPGPKSSGVHGTVQVTPFGIGGGSCLASGWKGIKAGHEVFVHCYTAAGKAENRKFTVVYASANNVMGLNGSTDADILATGKGAITAPSVEYLSARHAKALVIQLYTGQYEVVLAGSEGTSKNGGDVQVSALNSRDYHCYVADWAQETNPVIYVTCGNGKGLLASTPFTVQWVVR